MLRTPRAAPLLLLLLAACRSGPTITEASGRPDGAPTRETAAQSDPPPPRPPSEPPSAAGSADTPRPVSEADAPERLAAALRWFCDDDRRPEDVVARFAPGAVEAGGRTLPPGVPFLIRTEAVESLYTTDPFLSVIWWPRPAPGAAITELHFTPESVRPRYDAVREALGLSEGTLLDQGHPLADLPHRHDYACLPRRGLELVLHETAWKGDAVGRLNETIARRPDPTPAAPPSGPGQAAADCAALSREHCMRRPGCTLESAAPPGAHGSPDYRCRPAEPPCETAVTQFELYGAGTQSLEAVREARRRCEATPGCAFREDRCYCPCRGSGRTAVPDGDEAPPCDCECGGGPPAVCAPQSAE